MKTPNRFEIELFISEYQSLSKDLLDSLSKFGSDVIYTMKEKGVSKDFDFPEMARDTFIRKIDTFIGGIKATEEAYNILKEKK